MFTDSSFAKLVRGSGCSSYNEIDSLKAVLTFPFQNLQQTQLKVWFLLKENRQLTCHIDRDHFDCNTDAAEVEADLEPLTGFLPLTCMTR